MCLFYVVKSNFQWSKPSKDLGTYGTDQITERNWIQSWRKDVPLIIKCNTILIFLSDLYQADDAHQWAIINHSSSYNDEKSTINFLYHSEINFNTISSQYIALCI